MEVGLDNGYFSRGDDENDENEEQEPKHVVEVRAPYTCHEIEKLYKHSPIKDENSMNHLRKWQNTTDGSKEFEP